MDHLWCDLATPTELPGFSTLATELQIKIFNFALAETVLIPRTIHIDITFLKNQSKKFSDDKYIRNAVLKTPVPALLHDCTLSRELALKVYQLAFQTQGENGSLRAPLYIIPNLDTLNFYFKAEDHTTFIEAFSNMSISQHTIHQDNTLYTLGFMQALTRGPGPHPYQLITPSRSPVPFGNIHWDMSRYKCLTKPVKYKSSIECISVTPGPDMKRKFPNMKEDKLLGWDNMLGFWDWNRFGV